MEDLNFNQKDILQKEFKSKMRGYDPAEVDGFLDGVIADYKNYQDEVTRLEEENQRLFAKVDELTKQVSVSRNVDKAQQPNTTVTNFDILKRLSNLEKHVFGSRLEDDQHNDSSL